MLNFGERKINKIGGSYMVAIPISWIRSVGNNLKTVKIEVNKNKEIVIAAGIVRQDSTDRNTTQSTEIMQHG
jgi:antitoxin component of MazEF toxin-antitoxin module